MNVDKSGSLKSNPKKLSGNNNNNSMKRKREDDGKNQKGPNPKKQKIDNNAPKNQQAQKPANNVPKSPVNNNKPNNNNNSGNFQRSPSTINNQKPQLQPSNNQNTQSRNETRGGNLFGSKKRAPTAPAGFLANKINQIKSGSDPKNQKQANEPKKEQNKNMSSMVQKAQTKLDGAHFRWINEQLYTTTGDAALKLFTKQPELFHEYHKGFESQVKGWPSNPVDIIIKQLEKKPLSTVIADFGCGNAKIGQTLKQKVHSFDLVAHNEHVIVCDIANVPLPDASVDVAVFSLSLMGTNYVDFLLEAYRVLKVGGELKIAEVKSRFDNIPKFLNVLRDLGFDLMNKDDSNKMFVLFNAKKTEREPKKHRNYELKPCKYKKR